jgi:hypothetical protein
MLLDVIQCVRYADWISDLYHQRLSNSNYFRYFHNVSKLTVSG